MMLLDRCFRNSLHPQPQSSNTPRSCRQSPPIWTTCGATFTRPVLLNWVGWCPNSRSPPRTAIAVRQFSLSDQCCYIGGAAVASGHRRSRRATMLQSFAIAPAIVAILCLEACAPLHGADLTATPLAGDGE